MEALELLVESSELELQAVVDQDEDDSAQPAVVTTQLTLKLSFYDIAPDVDLPADGSQPSPS